MKDSEREKKRDRARETKIWQKKSENEREGERERKKEREGQKERDRQIERESVCVRKR